MPVVRRILPRISKQPVRPHSHVENILHSIDRRIAALNDMTLRENLGGERIIRLYGPLYVDIHRAGWKNERDYSVRAIMEVAKPGPLGATATVGGIAMVADTPGARSQDFAVDPNQTLSILFSDASVEGRLYISTPLTPILDVPTMAE